MNNVTLHNSFTFQQVQKYCAIHCHGDLIKKYLDEEGYFVPMYLAAEMLYAHAIENPIIMLHSLTTMVSEWYQLYIYNIALNRGTVYKIKGFTHQILVDGWFVHGELETGSGLEGSFYSFDWHRKIYSQEDIYIKFLEPQ